MIIHRIQDGSALTLALEGRLDTTTVTELNAVIDGGLDGIEDLTFDFGGLEYISSAGLRTLLVAQKHINASKGRMKVTNVNDVVNEVFEVTGFSDILDIE